MLTIRTKLVAGLLACAVVLLAVGGLGIRGQSHSNADARTIFEQNLEPVLHIAKVRGAEFASLEAIDRLLISRNLQGVQAAQQQVARQKGLVDEAWSAYYPQHVSAGDERAAADAVQADRRLIDKAAATLFEQMARGDFAAAAATHAQLYVPAYETLMLGTGRLFELNERQARDAFADSQRSFHATRLESLVAIALGLGLMGVLLVALLRAIARPISAAASLADEIAGGRLNHTIDVQRNDEVGVLLRALQRMDGQLTSIVRDVRRRAESVASGSHQIAQGNDDLSQRTQEQASSLEEVASSMEQISATVKQNSDHASLAAELSRDTLASAEQSGRVASEAADAMAGVSAASQRINEIVGLIDEIAFQTNLLALNAAVEAARAGEQGRGFAVVAEAVRELSQRSATAAREIKQLIGESTAKVDSGVALVGASGQALGEMLVQVRKVNNLVAEIAAANAEQTSGIHQVSLAVGQLDEVTQQNAALVEQAAAASMTLQDQASGLLERVAFFQIHGDPSPDPAPAAQTSSSGGHVKHAVAPRAPIPFRASDRPAARPVAAAAAAAGGGEWQEF